MRFRAPAFILLILFILSLTGVRMEVAQVIPAYSEAPPVEVEGPYLTEPQPQEIVTAEAAVKVPELKIAAVGDIMLGRGVGRRLEKAGGYKYAFSGVEEVLKQGDIVFANLESPLTASTHGLSSEKKIVLKGSPDSIEAILSGGFNLLSLSNNHIMDYYDTGLYDTISLLDANGIAHSGAGKNIEEAGKPALIEKNGYRIGLLCYTDMAHYIYEGTPAISFAAGEDKAGVIPRDYETIRQAIARLRDSVDLLAVSLHWGIEESFTVTPEQVDFARKLLDDGADMILGHHPHQFQGIEIYKGKPILYSMGNFLFDQNDPENMETFIVEMRYEGKNLKSLAARPVRIADKCRAELQTGASAQNILTREAGLCEQLGTIPEIEGDMLVFRTDAD
jgi:poly-gamma-glutamate capsule biosynthesis protein CapA/YwtB (metallophosphatase superfamily)